MCFSVRGYGRASTDAQVRSTEQQEAVELEAFDLFRKVKPGWNDAQWGGFFRDEDTERISKFRERHSGSLILAASRPGDVILVANYDRIFASVVDVCETLELVRERRIKLLILDCDIDTTTDFGESVFKLLAVIKEMEVKEIRRRVREMNVHRRKIGLPCARAVIGWKNVSVFHEGRIRRYPQPDHVARRFGYDLLKQFTEWKKSFVQAHQFANSIGLKQMNGRRWTLLTFKKWLKAARDDFPLPNGSHDAPPIPPDAKPVVMNTISADV